MPKKQGRPQGATKHPWNEWFKQLRREKTLRLTRGEHYDIRTVSFRVGVLRAARVARQRGEIKFEFDTRIERKGKRESVVLEKI